MAVVQISEVRRPIGDSGLETGFIDAGGMSIVAHRWPAGSEFTDLLRAAYGETLCTAPHWFVVSKGAVGIRYVDDGAVEECRAGQVAYLRPGHTCWAIEDSELVELTPAAANAFHLHRVMATGMLG